jgi:hypothetical protein
LTAPSGPGPEGGRVPSTQEEVVASALAAVRRHLGTLFRAARRAEHDDSPVGEAVRTVRDAAQQAWSDAATPPKDPGPGSAPKLGESGPGRRAD